MMPTHQAPPPQRPGPYQESNLGWWGGEVRGPWARWGGEIGKWGGGHRAPAGRPRASTILAGPAP